LARAASPLSIRARVSVAMRFSVNKAGKPEPGTGRPYRGFGKCPGDALGITKQGANKLLRAAMIEKNLQAQVETEFPLSTDKLLVIGCLEPASSRVTPSASPNSARTTCSARP
jgi:hypothetical protein